MQDEEDIDQFEFQLPRLVVGQLHSDEGSPGAEQRSDYERGLLRAPFIGFGLVLVPGIHPEYDQVDNPTHKRHQNDNHSA